MDYEASDLSHEDEEESNELQEEALRLVDFFDTDGRIFYPKANIANLLTEDQLNKIGHCVKESFDSDNQTMSSWKELVDFGRQLCKPETHPRSQPWQGACNYKSMMITDAALEFGNRASTELLRGADLIQINVTGKDNSEEKQKRADRLSIFENYQLNNNMPEWRTEQSKLIYDLPYTGTVFKKVYYDSSLGRNVSELIRYPNFVVDNNVDSLHKLRRFSEVFVFSKNAIQEKIRADLWIDNVSYGENDDNIVSTAHEDNQDVSENDYDQDTRFIEQQCWYDIDEDGYDEPYTVVIQESSAKVVRIIPRYELKDVTIKLELEEEPYPFLDLSNVKTLEQYIAAGLNVDFDVVRIKPSNNLIKYGFIPNPEGQFLDVGYYYLLSQATAACNTITNQLVDSGSLANLQGGYLAKDFRKKMGDMAMAPGQYIQTGLSSAELQNGIMPYPFKEPSPLLYQLRNDIIMSAQNSSSSVDLKDIVKQNSPAATTYAVVDDEQMSHGAIIQRMYETESEEFKLLFKLDSLFADPQEYMMIVDDPEANFERDFDLKGLDVTPSANPETASRMMRIHQAQAELQAIDQVVAVGGDPKPIVKNYYEALGSNVVDQIFPEATPEQQLQELLSRNPQLEAMIMGAREQSAIITKVQADQTEASTALMKADAERKRVEALEKMSKLPHEVQIAAAELRKTDSETILNLEKAETEQTKNAISQYTHAEQIDNPKLEAE